MSFHSDVVWLYDAGSCWGESAEEKRREAVRCRTRFTDELDGCTRPFHRATDPKYELLHEHERTQFARHKQFCHRWGKFDLF